MASAFDVLLAAADRTIDVVNGEAFDFIPMREVVDANSQPDLSRSPVYGLTAAFVDEGAELVVNSPAGPMRSSSGPQISVIADYLPQGVRRFDRFTRLSDGQEYEVTRVNPDGLGRLALNVVEIETE